MFAHYLQICLLLSLTLLVSSGYTTLSADSKNNYGEVLRVGDVTVTMSIFYNIYTVKNNVPSAAFWTG